MAPRGRRGDSEEPQAYHELGVRGRKTGAVIKDTGERDEHGFQPVDSIFSSPQKGGDDDDDEDDEGSVEMDIADSAGPGPRTLLRDQRNRLSQSAKSQSPVATRKSPGRPAARANRVSPMPMSSSEDEAEGATRKIDFTAATNGRPKTNGLKKNAAVLEESEEEEAEEGQEVAAKAPVAASRGRGRPRAGPSPRKAQPPPESEEESEQEEDGMALMEAAIAEVDSDIQAADDDDEQQPESEPEPEPEPEPQPTKKRGRPPAAKKASVQQPKSPEATRGKKRRSLRSSTGDGEEVEEEQQEEVEEERQSKRAKTTNAPALKAAREARAAKAASSEGTEPKPKGRRGRKPKAVADEDAGETSFMAIQRGPPLPKSRGLVSVRAEPDVITQTRSGRQSFKPLNYWRGEQVITTNEARADAIHRGKGGGFVVGGTKEIVRVEDNTPSTSSNRGRRGAHRGGARGRPKMHAVREEPEEKVELEDWENSPGTIDAEVILWENEHETQPPTEDDEVQVRDERLAISAPAIHMRDIKDATFRFAKTLTLPFMGAGVVDLPPGAEKRPKNSRKMHLVFFVHSGKVEVGVNEVIFRISAGGIFFVPRGNYYRISNDYDKPARIFFSQGCEMSSEGAMGDMTQMSVMAPGGSD